jgi:hypothetical protein
MALQTRTDHRTGEDAEDLRAWLLTLPLPHEVSETLTLTCPQHGDTAPTWMYVEADPAQGVARRRCLSCAHSVHSLDSEAHWTFPQMWACRGCGHSIAEVAAGLSGADGTVDWIALAVRCVECGRLAGLTDMVLPGLPHDEVVAGL